MTTPPPPNLADRLHDAAAALADQLWSRIEDAVARATVRLPRRPKRHRVTPASRH